MNPIIETIELSKTYPRSKSPALDRVSFSVQSGTFTAILGRSGSGKSTLFRCLNLLTRPSSGEVRILGQAWQQFNAHDLCEARRQMATIFQQFNLVSRLSVIDNVLAGQLFNIPFWRVAARRFPPSFEAWALHCLDRVGLADLADRRASELSGGQQQRVAIARALAQRPRIILADEPVASLDPESAIAVLNELRKIVNEDGITVVCSLHQEQFALQYTDRVIGLREGQVVVDVPCDAFTAQQRAHLYQLPVQVKPPAKTV